MSPPPFHSPQIEAAFAAFPAGARAGLLHLRGLIFETAGALPQVGRIEEALKWGQPAYLTPKTKSGSTIRLGCPRQGGFALYTHCRTSLMRDFRQNLPVGLSVEGNRALLFADHQLVPEAPLRLLIAAALTYHRRGTP
ncbi:DUF1801 domain-containing protein [Paracoccus marinaquae]|uniref:DUF1801 domain-containing protein n=1 Tax=Paracoccus marinaquae TaxID=2841926 RepID=A0ABS6AMT5_9RHOB|nr:DUF1801 domain-containing protein [Paracoccus marinaquae]MBU3031804.1 DUF1801 domain-containing protein [Paracoccus marinaquae]